jgi:hypothetical protein
LTNFIVNQSFVKKGMGVASKREVPLLAPKSFRKWYEAYKDQLEKRSFIGKVYLFCDEFTNYYDVQVGVDALNC